MYQMFNTNSISSIFEQTKQNYKKNWSSEICSKTLNNEKKKKTKLKGKLPPEIIYIQSKK